MNELNNWEQLNEDEQNEIIMNISLKLSKQEVWYWMGLVHQLRNYAEEKRKLEKEKKEFKKFLQYGRDLAIQKKEDEIAMTYQKCLEKMKEEKK